MTRFEIVTVRDARSDDVERMVEVADFKRREYQPFAPLFCGLQQTRQTFIGRGLLGWSRIPVLAPSRTRTAVVL